MRILQFLQDGREDKANFLDRVAAVAETYGEDRVVSLSFSYQGNSNGNKWGWWAYLLVK
jgi:hypothetical protein